MDPDLDASELRRLAEVLRRRAGEEDDLQRALAYERIADDFEAETVKLEQPGRPC